MSSLFGSATLVNKAGEPCDSSCLDGKTIGVYFASKACAHCSEFTRELIRCYKDSIKRRAAATEQHFEVVFVSMDKDEAAAQEHFAQMPWLMLSFSDSATKTRLTIRFDVHTIPSLIVLDEKGELLTTDGLSLVSRNIPVREWKEKATGLGSESMTGKVTSTPPVALADTGTAPEEERERGGNTPCASCGSAGRVEGQACANCGSIGGLKEDPSSGAWSCGSAVGHKEAQTYAEGGVGHWQDKPECVDPFPPAV